VSQRFLEARGLAFGYGRQPLLKGISLAVDRGQILGLVGPNGAGKTTLLRLLAGTLAPWEGEVLLEGVPLPALPPKERARRVAVVAQSPTVPAGFSALDVVLLGRTPHLGFFQWEGNKDMAIARKAMELTQCWPLARRPIQWLSGGERQRVFIARALAQEPSLLLLDEPTAHLDLGYQSSILDMVSRIVSERHVAVVAAMHDLTLAAQYCHSIAMLRDGCIAAQGAPAQVLTQELLAATYGPQVSVVEHPAYGTPVVLALKGQAKKPYSGREDENSKGTDAN